MKAIILDGSGSNDRTGRRVCAALEAAFAARRWDVEHVVLETQKIGNCAGDFFCWVRSPGICNVNDDNRAIASAIAASDVLVYLSPVRFGGYSSTLKRMVDHQIQNVSPFFTRVEGETHHIKRYRINPDMLAVGWLDAPSPQAEAIFRHLVQRNAINFHAKTHISAVVLGGQTDEEMRTGAQKWLDDLENGRSSGQVQLPASRAAVHNPVEVQRALLLVGSPKTRKSTSNSLGEYLFDRLSSRSIRTSTVYLHTVLRNPEKLQALMEELDAADLVTLAFPLYVDSLPAPVIEALERIAAHHKSPDPYHRQLFTAIINCGFPEAFQCHTARSICETFARQAGFEWAGSLALGGGQMIDGAPLDEAGGMAIRIRTALEMAADALGQGLAISHEAADMMASPVIPHWAYRLLGGLGWLQRARHYKALRLLVRRPYEVENN